MKNKIQLILATVAVALLTACGGGGGGGGGSTTTPPVTSTLTFPLFATYVNSLQSRNYSFTISGTINGTPITGSGTNTSGNPTPATFEGESHQKITTVVSGFITANGQNTPLNATVANYYDAGNLPIGDEGDDYVVVRRPAVIPASVRVNDTGTIYTADLFPTSAKGFPRKTEVLDFAIEADTATTAIFKSVLTERNSNGKTLTISTSEIRIRVDGSFDRIKQTSLDLQDNTNLTFTVN